MKFNKKLTMIITAMLVVIMSLTMMVGCGSGSSDNESGEAASGDTVVLRLASDAPEDHIATGINKELCDMVAERTEGRVQIDYYPGSQLGSYETVYDEVKMGTIDLAQISLPDTSDPRLSLPYMNYYALSFDQAKTLYGEDTFVTNLFTELTAKDDVEFMGWLLEGFIGIGTTKEATDFTTPGADKKLKIRIPTTATWTAIVDLGFEGVTIPYSETPTAIQTNVVDGWVGGTANMNYAWLGDILSNYYFCYASPEATCYIGSNKALAKLSDEDRAILEECFWEQSAKSFDAAEDSERSYVEKLEAKGVVVTELTMEEREAIAEFVRETTWPKLEETMGKETIDGLRADLEKYIK